MYVKNIKFILQIKGNSSMIKNNISIIKNNISIIRKQVEEGIEAVKVHENFYEKLISFCESDIIEIQKKEITFLKKHFNDLLKRLNNEKVLSYTIDDIWERNQKKEMLKKISSNKETLTQIKDFFELTLEEHELFYELNEEDLEDKTNMLSTYSDLLYLNNLTIDDTNSYIKKLNCKVTEIEKKAEKLSEFEYIVKNFNVNSLNADKLNIDKLNIDIENIIHAINNIQEYKTTNNKR